MDKNRRIATWLEEPVRVVPFLALLAFSVLATDAPLTNAAVCISGFVLGNLYRTRNGRS